MTLRNLCQTLTLPAFCTVIQGIDDAESEWSQHHAKRMIDTRAKGLRGSIPPNFPYFHVEFGLSGKWRYTIVSDIEP